MNNENKASTIAYQACNMYDKDSSKIEGSFTMYSHDRFSSLIIQGIAKGMLNQGCTEEQVKYALKHKAIRWMLDGEEDTLIEFGMKLAAGHKLAEVGKECKGE